MTRAAKITYLFALLIGFSVGAYFKVHATMAQIESYFEMMPSVAPRVLDDFSYAQYKHADTEHARAALKGYVDLLEEMQNGIRIARGTENYLWLMCGWRWSRTRQTTPSNRTFL